MKLRSYLYPVKIIQCSNRDTPTFYTNNATKKLTIRCVEHIEVFVACEALTHLPVELLVLHAQSLLLGVDPHDHLVQHPVVLHQLLLEISFAHQLGPEILHLQTN